MRSNYKMMLFIRVDWRPATFELFEKFFGCVVWFDKSGPMEVSSEKLNLTNALTVGWKHGYPHDFETCTQDLAVMHKLRTFIRAKFIDKVGSTYYDDGRYYTCD